MSRPYERDHCRADPQHGRPSGVERAAGARCGARGRGRAVQRGGRIGRIAVLVVALGGVVALSVALSRRAAVGRQIRAINDPDPACRAQAMYKARHSKHRRVVEAIVAALAREHDRGVLGRVAYAAMCTGDPRALALLRRCGEAGPDDRARADCIANAARHVLADGSQVEWLVAGARSHEPWRQVGSAAGLLALGKPHAGLMLIEIGRRAEPVRRQFAIEYLRRTAGPMAEAVGQPIDWPGSPDDIPDRAWWDRLETFWRRFGQERLLLDVLETRHGRDRKWSRMNRLLIARDVVARWLP